MSDVKSASAAPPPPSAAADAPPAPPAPTRRRSSRIVIPKVNLEPDEEYRNAPPQAPYYWEPEAVNVPESNPAAIGRWKKVWHNVHFYGAKAIDGGEVVGEVVAGFLGLTESKFQYVIDALEQEQDDKDRQEKEEEERAALAAAQAAATAETGEMADVEMTQPGATTGTALPPPPAAEQA